ncbi:MAG: TIGR00341 family protein [Candidatus Heimdallarchaeota archaeon]
MKQIQVTVPTEEGTDIIKSLDEVVSPSQLSLIHGVETSVILITVSPTRTGFVLDHLANLGIGRVKGRISITNVVATIPRTRPRKQDKFLYRISIEEMEQSVASLTSMDRYFFVWIFLSSILAAIGLINDDNVTLIASMIISPMMGPIIGIAFGAVTNNEKILKEGLFAESLGVLMTIFIGFIVGLLYRLSQDEPSSFIIQRGEPNVVNLLIAIVSGIAAGMVFVSGTSLALVGVAAAAALLPVSVNLGIAIGLFEWQIVLGSLVLFVTNVASVHLGCMLVFRIMRVEPPQEVKKIKAKRSLRNQIIGWTIILLVVTFPIAQTTGQLVRKWRFQNITTEVADDFLGGIDGYISTEASEVVIGGSVFSFTVNISITVFATKLLPNSTQINLQDAIASRAGHAVNLKLTVILSQDFESASMEISTISLPMLTKINGLGFSRVLCPNLS